MRKNTPGVIIEGKGFYKVGNELIPDETFYKLYPIASKVEIKTENNPMKLNPDKTKDWLHG